MYPGPRRPSEQVSSIRGGKNGPWGTFVGLDAIILRIDQTTTRLRCPRLTLHAFEMLPGDHIVEVTIRNQPEGQSVLPGSTVHIFCSPPRTIRFRSEPGRSYTVMPVTSEQTRLLGVVALEVIDDATGTTVPSAQAD
jgi:hypothetical protein